MKLSIIVILLFVLSYIAGQWLSSKKVITGPVHIYQSDCDLTKTACQVVDGDYKYIVQFNGEVSPLKPFSILLTTENLEPITVDAEFLMEDMDMGYNKQPLHKEESKWQARVILPVCSLGRKDWVLKLNLVYADTAHQTQFKFRQ